MVRIRLHLALDCFAYSLEAFSLDNIEPIATIAMDDWKDYLCLYEYAFRFNHRKPKSIDKSSCVSFSL